MGSSHIEVNDVVYITISHMCGLDPQWCSSCRLCVSDLIIVLGRLVMRFAKTKSKKKRNHDRSQVGPFDWRGRSSTKLKRDPLAQQEGLLVFPHEESRSILHPSAGQAYPASAFMDEDSKFEVPWS